MAELSKTYDPKTVEAKWYQRWIDQGDFKADPESKKKPFSIVMPPPNITGVLTLGHVLNNTIQDILARRARMLDKPLQLGTPRLRSGQQFAHVGDVTHRQRQVRYGKAQAG